MIEFNVKETRDILMQILCTSDKCSLKNVPLGIHVITQNDDNYHNFTVVHG